MSGLGALDSLSFELSQTLITEFGGTGKIEIETITSNNGYSGSPTKTTTTIDNIAITPPSPFIQDTGDNDPVKSGQIETYVSVADCTTEPIEQQSYLTIYKTDFLTQVITSGPRMKITEVNPVMGGNSDAMYQLICEGIH